MIPKPPGYPKPETELKFSVLESTGAWAANDSRADPPNKGQKPAPRGPSDCLEGVTFVITGILDSLERDEAEYRAWAAARDFSLTKKRERERKRRT